MDSVEHENVIEIDDSVDDTSVSDIVCIYPEVNGVTVNLHDYLSLEDISI